MNHEAHEGRSPAGRPVRHRLLPIAGGIVAVAAVLAHLGLGAAVVANLGGGALMVGLAAVAVKVLLVLGAGRWLRHRDWLRHR